VNRHSKLLLCGALIAWTAGINTGSAQDYGAGYQVLRIVDEGRKRPIHLDVWYPTVGRETEHSYGLSVGRVATDGAIAGKGLALIVLSHGAMGAASNYSWLAEHLARRGYVVLGVSHFKESPVFGPESLEVASVARFGDRTRDLNYAVEFLLTRSPYAPSLDSRRIGAIGHSSGGASVLMMAGAEFSAADVSAYCASGAAAADKGCSYPMTRDGDVAAYVPVASQRPLKAVVVFDPAVGAGFTARGKKLTVPTLVVGAVNNDFLPYAAHAGRIRTMVSGAESVRLENGEGHFVFVDQCASSIDVMGVPLCSDRPGVNRGAVHDKLAVIVEQFLARHLAR